MRAWLRMRPQKAALRLGDAAVSEATEPVTGDVTDETAVDGDAAELPAFLTDDTGTSSDEPVAVPGEEPDHLQAAE